jgi:serine/threonine protein kinase
MSHAQGSSNLEYRVGDQPVPGYRLIRELGRGAMGVVWLAQTDSGFERALKVINLRQRGGKKEYRGLRTIKQRKLLHGNLLTLIDYWLKDASGQTIPDSDDLENTDSFFAPKNSPQGPLSLTQTTPQSITATDTAPRSPMQRPPLPTQRAQTMVSRETIGNLPLPDDPSNPSNPNAPSGLKSGPALRPVQLIVAMELGHKTLDDRQKQCQEDKLMGIPSEELLAYVEQAARGLDYLHREGIIHRDIKPQNIMLVGDVAKVCDYGLVVTTEADLRSTSNAFTPLYASPEAVGEQPLTGRSDQYSLAVTYIELRTGKSPYSSETAASVYAAKETGKYDLSRIRKGRVRNVLRRALARQPAERYTTCSEFVRELETAERSSAVWGLLIGAAALILLALGGSLAVPGVPQRILAFVDSFREVPKTNRNNELEDQENRTNQTKSEEDRSTKTELEIVTPPPPPPPASEREIIAEARKLRLAGQFNEARTKLTELKIQPTYNDREHWHYSLEYLSNEVGSQLPAATAVPADQWLIWRDQAAQLAAQSTDQGIEGVLLAALRVLIESKLDSAPSALDPLAHDFSRAMAGANQWNQVLRDEEQFNLRTLRDGLRQRFLTSDQPLPADWKTNLHLIWSDHDALQLLIDRVRHQYRDNNEPGLLATETDLKDLANQFLPNAPDLEPQLTALRADLERHQQQASLARLESYLLEDLTVAAVRSRLSKQLDALGPQVTAPLVVLLRAELELEAGGSRRLTEQRNKIRSALVELDQSENQSDHALAGLARYLRARIDFQIYSKIDPEDLKLLSAWPAPIQSDWHTPSRTAQVAAIMLRLADAELPLHRTGEWELFNASSDRVAAAIEYLEKAKSLNAASSAAQSLQSLVTGINAHRANDIALWKHAADFAAAALADWPVSKDAPAAARKPAVEFVAATAAARLKNDQSPAANRAALATFSALLQRHFHEDAPAEANDEALYSQVVVPALELPVNASESSVRELLAALWLAKARLLERDNSSSLVGTGAENESRDSFSRTILAANQAYENARKLDASSTAASGFARTLLKLSRDDFSANRQQHADSLSQIVQRYDPQGNSDNPGLRLASAWVDWENAMQEASRERKLEGVARSLRHYRSVISTTALRDPYSLNALALTLSSNAHVRAAFHTSISTADLTIAKDNFRVSDKDPQAMSKHEHLQQAVALAQAAEQDDKLRLPEETYTSEGNGLEDLAYYCKETHNYADACRAFETASQKTGLRSKLYPLLSLGRCQYRWSIEPADVNMTRSMRHAKLREAFTTLTNALGSAAQQDSRDSAEAQWWLAQAFYSAALDGPGGIAADEKNAEEKTALEAEPLRRLVQIYSRNDASRPIAEAELKLRLQNFEQAWRLSKRAADMAAMVAPQDRATYWLDSLAFGLDLATYLKPFEKLLPTVARGALLVELRTNATQFLELSERDPATYSRPSAQQALLVLVGANANMIALNGQNIQNSALAALKKWEPLFRAPADHNLLVDVLLQQAKLGDGESAIDNAEKIANDLPEGERKESALGKCLLTRAQLRYDAYLNAAAAKAAGRNLAPLNFSLKDIVDGYAQAEQRQSRAHGEDVVNNLALLRKTKIAAIQNRFVGGFTSNLELHRLRQFVESTYPLRHEGANITKQWLEIRNLQATLPQGKAPPPAEIRALETLIHNFLKPTALLYDRLTPDERILIEKLE